MVCFGLSRWGLRVDVFYSVVNDGVVKYLLDWFDMMSHVFEDPSACFLLLFGSGDVRLLLGEGNGKGVASTFDVSRCVVGEIDSLFHGRFPDILGKRNTFLFFLAHHLLYKLLVRTPT